MKHYSNSGVSELESLKKNGVVLVVVFSPVPQMTDFFLAPHFLMWRMKLLKDQVQGLGVMKFFVSPVLGNFQQVLPLTAWVLSAFYARAGSPNYFLGFLFCFDIG